MGQRPGQHTDTTKSSWRLSISGVNTQSCASVVNDSDIFKNVPNFKIFNCSDYSIGFMHYEWEFLFILFLFIYFAAEDPESEVCQISPRDDIPFAMFGF